MPHAEKGIANLQAAVISGDVKAILEVATDALDYSLLPGLSHDSKRPAMRLVVGAIFAASVIHVRDSGINGPTDEILNQLSLAETDPGVSGDLSG